MFIGLAYHSVSDSDYRYAASPGQFERELMALKARGAEFVMASKLRDILEKGTHKGKLVVSVTFDDGLEDNFTAAYPVLKRLGIPATIYVIAGNIGTTQENAGKSWKFLNWEQVREMQGSGLIEIGSHTHTHPDLSSQSVDTIEREFDTAAKVIEKNLGTEPLTIAYPKGRNNQAVRTAAAKYSSLAFAKDGILQDSETCDLYATPRITIVNGLSPGRFRFMCSPWYWRLKRLRTKIPI